MEIVFAAIGFLGLLAWGDWLVRRLWPGFSQHSIERSLAGFGLLFGIGAFALHGLGFAGLLYWPLVPVLLFLSLTGIGLWIVDWRRVRRPIAENEPTGHPAGLSTTDRLFVIALILVAAINILGCLTPEIRDDTLHNHQAIPAGYANAHRIDIHPFNANMGRPQLLHAWYMLPLLFQNVFGPKLIHTMLALVGIAALGLLAAQNCDRKALWPSLFLFYTLPVVTLYAVCAYVDLGRIFFELFPLWLILRFQQNRRWSVLVLAAVIFGFGTGVHWMSMFFGWPALTATVFFAVLLGGGERRLWRAIGAAALFGAISAALFAPWIIRNAIFLGNPMQPLFRVPAGSGEAQRFSPEVIGYLSNLKELPQRTYLAIRVMTIEGNSAPILLIAAIVLKFVLRDRDPRRSAMLLFAVFLLLLFAITLPMQDGRYILPALGVAVVVFFHYVERMLAGYPRYRVYLAGGVLALGLLNFGLWKQKLYVVFGEPPWPVYSKEAVQQFLIDRFTGGGTNNVAMDEWRMRAYINRTLPDDSRVLLEDIVGALYIWKPFMGRNYGDPHILNSLVRLTEDNAELLERLRRYGVTHVLAARGFSKDNLTEKEAARLERFVRENLRLIERIGQQELYEIVSGRMEDLSVRFFPEERKTGLFQ